ncbi:MAG: endonuclease NucS [Thermoplasmata archaeon]|nr:MAG: endonuclease NucS [Thermoplasmata archaeon]
MDVFFNTFDISKWIRGWLKETVKALLNPTLKECLEEVKLHHQHNPEKSFLQIIGNCQVDYHGRARSFIDWGERIILIKQDGNVLVHQPIMREPINWQPSGSKTQYYIKKDLFIVSVTHKKPDEKMKIIFNKIDLVTIANLTDTAKINICGMETDVVKTIIENPSCVEEGLRIQKQEKQVKSGMIDLYAIDKDFIPVVIEVKRSLATINAVHQLRMYVNDIKQGNNDAKVRGILCAPHIPDMVRNLLNDYNLEWMEVDHEIVLPDDFQKTLTDFK